MPLQEIREQKDAKELERASYRDKAIAAEKKSAELDATNKAIIQQLAEQKQFLIDAEGKLREAFASLSFEALRKNSTSFLEAAKETQNRLSLREDISAREKTLAIKEVDKLEAMIKDCKIYEKTLFNTATQKITIDLDDGVKVNYLKFKEVGCRKNS